MTIKTIATERLVLRPLTLDDAHECARLIGDIEVSRWLTVVPHPYSVEDAEDFIQKGDPEFRFGIEIGGGFAGVVSANTEVGYWLGKPHWRNGYMREAVLAAVASWFNGGGGDMTSGYFVGNDASQRILACIGFLPTVLEPTICKATGLEMPLQKMALSCADWRARHG